MKRTSSLDFRILNSVIVFEDFFSFRNTFKKKVIIYSDRAWNSLSSYKMIVDDISIIHRFLYMPVCSRILVRTRDVHDCAIIDASFPLRAEIASIVGCAPMAISGRNRIQWEEKDDNWIGFSQSRVKRVVAMSVTCFNNRIWFYFVSFDIV
jgi:hypothetical protein